MLLAAAGGDVELLERGRLASAQLAGDLAKPGGVGHRPVPGPLLQPIEDLHHHRLGEPVQADLPRSLDGRFGLTPAVLVEAGIGAAPGAQSFVVAAAVAPVPAFPTARIDLTRLASPGRPGAHGDDRVVAGLVGADPAPAAYPVAAIDLVGASLRRANPPAKQGMLGRQRQHPARPVPAGLGQEPRIDQGGQSCHRRLESRSLTQNMRRCRRDGRAGHR